MRERARWDFECELGCSLDVLRERAAVENGASHHKPCGMVADLKRSDILPLLNDVSRPVAAAYGAFEGPRLNVCRRKIKKGG